ncbi:MAG: HU family DNA-binding protein [Phycisphaerales bacterium]|jgi:integration host factor subunit beta|nr:HU family DNA-binding protein [Phycisphaerales bacterium]MDP6692875.1 HU family DNA-binding protein [Phycisphaerales bacterium]
MDESKKFLRQLNYRKQRLWIMAMSNTATTKKDLIDRIADETRFKRSDVRIIVQKFLDDVILELSEGRRLEFRNFGVFELNERAPRMAQNPKTLERVPVPARRTVKFKPGKIMKEAVDFPSDSKTEMPLVETVAPANTAVAV